MRLRDPVYGCMGAISTLQQQVQCLQAELNVVRNEIMKYKYREASNIMPSSHQPHHVALLSSGAVSVAAAPSPPPHTPPPPPPPPPPPLPSTPSCSSSIYAQPITSAADYNTISGDQNVSYFG